METVETVDPKEAGLDEKQVKTIESAFMPKIVERDALKEIYQRLITSEITPELAKEAGEVRKKLGKVRTGIADIHKVQKAYFLAGGRFVDAWKNKETTLVEQMEESLRKIETHYERLEAERLEKLKDQRIAQLSKVCSNPEIYNCHLLGDLAFNELYNGLKLAKEARKESERKAEAERLRIEQEKEAEAEKLRNIEKLRWERAEVIRPYYPFFKDDGSVKLGEITEDEFRAILADLQTKKQAEDLHDSRKDLALPYYEYWGDFEKTLHFGTVSDSDFNAFLSRIKASKEARDVEVENQRKENDKLKAEAEERERVAAEQRAEADRKLKAEQDAARKAAEEAEAERKRLQKELDDKKAAEEKAAAEAKKAAEKAAKAPKKQKLNTWIDGLNCVAPVGLEADETALLILEKFEGFRKWAKTQIENL
jgi:hypothetical protein